VIDKEKDYEIDCSNQELGDHQLKVLTPNAVKRFEELVLKKVGKYTVTITAYSLNTLIGDVSKTKNGSVVAQRLCVTIRNGVVTCSCPCMMKEEYGHCCGGLIALIQAGATIDVLPGMKEVWDFRRAEFYDTFMHNSEWKKQLCIRTTPLKTLSIFEKSLSDEALLKKVIADGIANVPKPIPGLAGRPKNKKKNGLNKVLPRLVPAGEKKGRKVKKTAKAKENDAIDEEKLLEIGWRFFFLFFFKKNRSL
jgi:hypothetical protein